MACLDLDRRAGFVEPKGSDAPARRRPAKVTSPRPALWDLLVGAELRRPTDDGCRYLVTEVPEVAATLGSSRCDTVGVVEDLKREAVRGDAPQRRSPPRGDALPRSRCVEVRLVIADPVNAEDQGLRHVLPMNIKQVAAAHAAAGRGGRCL